MGRVPSKKIDVPTHEILLGKERKGNKIVGEGGTRGDTQMGLRTIRKEEKSA